MAYFYIVLFCICNFLFSASITDAEAMKVAENLFTERSKNNQNFLIKNIDIIQSQDINLYYIFHLNPQGFIMVSGDNRALPILGYSFDNNFITENQPGNISYLMNLFKEEIIEAIELNSDQTPEIKEKWQLYLSDNVNPNQSIRSIAPLLSCRMNQDYPWNAMCPVDGDGPGDHVYAGCVAVSMAQIIYYWKYPQVGYGSHGYYSNYGYLQVNFGQQTYDYDLMQDNVGTEETQKLLYHCGVGVEMGYSPSGSGAWVGYGNINAKSVLEEHFLYDSGISYTDNYQNTNSYRNTIENELNNNRPLISRGCSNDGCHAWNFDGYEGDLIHCNWGWGGYNNGFFTLSSMGGFGYDQGVVYNIIPSSLDSPRLRLSSYTTNEINGDMDQVINPGEQFELITTIESMVPWDNAFNINAILISENEDFIVSDDNFVIANIDAGDNYANVNDPFTITINSDISLGQYDFSLYLSAEGEGGGYFEDSFSVQVPISLDQNHFPYGVENVVESSPAIIDVNDDGRMEMFFGDYSGIFHGVDSYGEPLAGFPYEVEGDGNKPIWGAVAAADIDLDGVYEFAFGSKNKHFYVIDQFGNVEINYDAEQFLMGDATIVQLDDDPEYEIVFSGYNSSGKVFALNHDGSMVSGFPAQINQKILKGSAATDLNNNSYDDIVVVTDNNHIFIVYDDGQFEEIFEASSKFKASPSILDIGGEKYIIVGSESGTLYGIDLDGEVRFTYHTGSNIQTAPGFITLNNKTSIFFGSNNGYLYGIDSYGNDLEGWPVDLGGQVSISPVFADLNNDGNFNIISGVSDKNFQAFDMSGNIIEQFPIQPTYGVYSSPAIYDIDGDNDLELIAGSSDGISVIDIKSQSSIISDESNNNWNMHRGDLHRTGYYSSSAVDFSIGDINMDTEIDVLDIVLLVNFILDDSTISDIEFTLSDMNSDQTLDILDIVQLINRVLYN